MAERPMDDQSADADPLTRRSPLVKEVDDCRTLLGQDPDVIQDVCWYTRTGRPLGSEIRYMSLDFRGDRQLLLSRIRW